MAPEPVVATIDETNLAAPGGPARTWSLRREWGRAFTIILALLLVASIGIFAGVRHLADQYGNTAHDLDLEMTTIASLDAAVSAHEYAAHQLLNGEPSPGTFLEAQLDLSDAFTDARTVFPSGDVARILARARAAWQLSMTKAGLWGVPVITFVRPASSTVDEQTQVTLGADGDAARALLADLQQPSLVAMRADLANNAGLERLLWVALTTMFGLAVCVTVYFRRRMTKDLLRPVARLHEGVLKLQGGQYDHHIDVARHDELGELAEAFNAMSTALHRAHVAMTLRATHDTLTGLPNRASLAERLAASFRPGSERRTRQESVLFIDVDDFKDVNDSLGHEAGDDLLIQLAQRLNDCVRPGDLVARLGGDEFAIVVVEDDNASTAVEIAERILAALRAPFLVHDTRLAVAVSIGIAHRNPDIADADEILRQADFAMYMAKDGGKDRYQLFNPEMHDIMVGRASLKKELAVAVTAGQLRLEYQPVVDLGTGSIRGVEALVRWQHPTLGLLAPETFIPLAEETGDIDAMGCWVLDTAVRQAAMWRRTIDGCADLWVSVNLSAFQLFNAHSRAAIQSILADPTVDASKIVLEITETAVAVNVEGGIAALEALKLCGARIAMDDFGTGFSSLSTLASLPADILKIDRSFVSGQTSVSPSAPMLEGIMGLADKLALEVIAEGIEEPEQLALLRAMDCHLGQGFLLARPTTAHGLEALLASGRLFPVAVAAP